MYGRGAFRLLSLPVAALLAAPSFAQDPFVDDDGLSNFVTRPEIRVPKLDVRIYDKHAVAPGYWFVAPYNTNNNWEAHHGPLFEACQVGPAIYDSNGDLIWSGACMFNNMNAFDFRPADYAGKKYLSLNVGRGSPSIYGAGIILSDTYEIVREIQMSGHTDSFNQHEFSVVDDGQSVIYVTEQAHEVSATGIGLGDDSKTWARSTGIKEESLTWGHQGVVNFEWDCIDQIPLNESTYPWIESPDEGRGWDYMHMNSIDKFPDGDYLISMRYSNSLIRVSGSDGTIVWRLGGKFSDFKMKDDFRFSRQHHGRILSTNSTHTIVSLLDNAAGSLVQDEELTAKESSALIVLLSHDLANRESWTAEILRRFPRPDGDYSHLRGSFQVLSRGPSDDEFRPATERAYPSSLTHVYDRYPDWESSNVFVGWSKDGYMTEFLPNGSIAVEARFVTNWMDTYRAFKYDGFVGRPTEPPVLKAFAFGDVTGHSSAIVDGTGRGVGQTMTVAYVSWNGATEVKAWRVYGEVVQDGAAVVLNHPSTYEDTYGLTFGAEKPSPSAPTPSSAYAHEEEGEAASYHTFAAALAAVSALPSSLSGGEGGSEYQGAAEPANKHVKRDDRRHPRSKIPRPTDAHPRPVTKHLGTFPRAGFETVITIPNAPVSRLWAEALDADGTVLGRTATTRTLVPGAQRPHDPAKANGDDGRADALRKGGGAGYEAGAGDWAFADESEGLISLTKVAPQAAAAAARSGGAGGWGYESVRTAGRPVGFGVVVGIGAGVGVVAACCVLAVWWAWARWGKEADGKGCAVMRRVWMRGRKGKGRKGKGKYKAVARGEEGDEEEGLELVEAGSEDGESEDEYLGEMSWAPVFGRGTAGVGLEAAGRGGVGAVGRGFDEEMTLGEVRRGLAQVREQRERQGSVAEWGAGKVPLVLQAKNKWEGEGGR